MMRDHTAQLQLLLLAAAVAAVPARGSPPNSSLKTDDSGCAAGESVVQQILAEAAAAALQQRQAEEAEAPAMAVPPRLDSSDGSSSSGRASKTREPLSHWRESLAPVHVDVRLAQRTSVVREVGLLSPADVALVLDICRRVQASTADPWYGNRQNEKHALSLKVCTFLHQRPPMPAADGSSGQTTAALNWPKLPRDPFRTLSPQILATLLRFADRAWAAQNWSAPGGPLADIQGPVVRGDTGAFPYNP